MANSYDSQIEQAEGNTPPGEEQSESQGSKVDQQAANYRMGNRQRSCGLCQNFTGSAGSDPYQCTKVAGDISPYGFSDYYARQDNPFISGFQEGFDAGSEGETPSEQPTASDVQDAPMQPRVQIGSRSY
jgi:hypothetical protein